MKKFLALAVCLVLALSASASINYPVNPNPSGLQTTPFSNSDFSATFNGEVKIGQSVRSADNHSSNVSYLSTNKDAAQLITVRTIDYDIAVNQASADFYADDDQTAGPISNRSTNVWEGHPFTYTMHVYTEDGVEYSKRTRFIIVNSREVIFIKQLTRNDFNDQSEWLDFEYSLRIK